MTSRIYYRTAAGDRGFLPCTRLEECERLLNRLLTGGGAERTLRHVRPDDPAEETRVVDETGAFVAAYRFVTGEAPIEDERVNAPRSEARAPR